MTQAPRPNLFPFLALALAACADVDSPFRIAERGSEAWSLGWIIAGVLVGATVAAGVVKLRIELAKKKTTTRGPGPTATTAPPPPPPRLALGLLFTGVLLFTGAIVLLVATFLAREVSLTELLVGAGIMVVGAALMVIAGRRLSAPQPGEGGQP